MKITTLWGVFLELRAFTLAQSKIKSNPRSVPSISRAWRMEAPKRQGWRITVRAKSKGLDLRLSASNVLPRWGSGGERVSFFVRLRRRFFLQVKSENQSPASRVPAAGSAAPTLAKPFEFLKKTFRRLRWFSRKNAASKSDSKLSVGGFLSAVSKQYRRQVLDFSIFIWNENCLVLDYLIFRCCRGWLLLTRSSCRLELNLSQLTR